MTTAQENRLREIVGELSIGKSHASESVRESLEPYSRAEIAAAVAGILRVLKSGDGYRAFKIVSAWHRGGSAAVLALARERRAAVKAAAIECESNG